MVGWPFRYAVVAAASGVLALSGSVQPASASHPAAGATTWWRITAKFGRLYGQADLTSVNAPSGQDAWATGFTVDPTGLGVSAMIRHWTGKTWQAVPLPRGVARSWNNDAPILAQIVASSPANAWVFNGIGTGPARYLRFNGNHWTTGTLPGGGRHGDAVLITSAKVFGPADVWAFGRTETFGPAGTTSPYAAHFDGKSWATVPVPGQGAITAVSSISPAHMWAVVGSITTQRISPGAIPAVLQWTARSAWRPVPVQPKLPRGAQLSSVLGFRGGRILVSGEAENSLHGTTPLAATWNGSAWTVTELPITASWSRWGLAELAANGDGIWGVVAADNVPGQQLWHLMRTRWAKVSPGFGWHVWQLGQLTAIPGTHSLWAAGAIRYGGTVDAMVALDGPTASVLAPIGRHAKSALVKSPNPAERSPRR
ncbi:MAG: hypothetical protein ACLQFR_04090 [Streptosporangiaceae bacterium]